VTILTHAVCVAAERLRPERLVERTDERECGGALALGEWRQQERLMRSLQLLVATEKITCLALEAGLQQPERVHLDVSPPTRVGAEAIFADGRSGFGRRVVRPATFEPRGQRRRLMTGSSFFRCPMSNAQQRRY